MIFYKLCILKKSYTEVIFSYLLHIDKKLLNIWKRSYINIGINLTKFEVLKILNYSQFHCINILNSIQIQVCINLMFTYPDCKNDILLLCNPQNRCDTSMHLSCSCMSHIFSFFLLSFIFFSFLCFWVFLYTHIPSNR